MKNPVEGGWLISGVSRVSWRNVLTASLLFVAVLVPYTIGLKSLFRSALEAEMRGVIDFERAACMRELMALREPHTAPLPAVQALPKPKGTKKIRGGTGHGNAKQ